MVVVSCTMYMRNKNKRILDLPQLGEVFMCCNAIAIKKITGSPGVHCTVHYKAAVINRKVL